MVQLLLESLESGGRTIFCSTNMPTPPPPPDWHEGVLLQVSLQESSHHLQSPPTPHQVMMFPWEDLKSELKKQTKPGSLLPPCRASSVPSVDTAAWGGGHQPEKDRERNSVDAPADLMVMCVHRKLKTHIEKQRADTHR